MGNQLDMGNYRTLANKDEIISRTLLHGWSSHQIRQNEPLEMCLLKVKQVGKSKSYIVLIL